MVNNLPCPQYNIVLLMHRGAVEGIIVIVPLSQDKLIVELACRKILFSKESSLLWSARALNGAQLPLRLRG